ncbi:hypothetical protein evm_012269 [Chilo suppressalis]|nr:hypothetical protein evm_012269 [Chilo suppressalis]
MASLKLYSVGRLAKYISDSTFQTLRGNVYRSASTRYYSTEEKTVENDSSDKLPGTIEECHKQIEALTTEVASLKDQIKDVDDKYKRALADGENVRRRMMKQVEDAKSFAIQSFCKDLLDVSFTALSFVHGNVDIISLLMSQCWGTDLPFWKRRYATLIYRK